MTAYAIVCDGRDREEWLIHRASSIGASEAPAIAGISRFGSPLSVYTTKVMGEEFGEISAITRFGRIFEKQIAADFAEATGRRLKLDGRMIRSRSRPWQSCTLDAVQYRDDRPDRGLAEIKTSLYGWDADGIPEAYWCQIQHQFAVTGLRWGSAIMFNRTNCEMVYEDVEPDEAYIDVLIDSQEGFWIGNVLEGRPPMADGHEATTAALRRLYPVPEAGKVIVLPIELLAVRAARREAMEEGAVQAAVKADCENRIRQAIGDAEGGMFPDGSGFTWKANKNGVRSLREKEKF